MDRRVSTLIRECHPWDGRGGDGTVTTDSGERDGNALGTGAALAVALALMTVLAVPAPAVGPASSSATHGIGTASADGGTPTTVTACGTLASPGTYVLGDDLDAGGGECLVVAADDVVIDGNGHRIHGATTAVVSTGAHSNLTVRDVTLNASSAGIELANATGVRVENVAVASDDRAVSAADGADLAVVGSYFNTTGSDDSDDGAVTVLNYTGTVTVERTTVVTPNADDGVHVRGGDGLDLAVRDSTLRNTSYGVITFGGSEAYGLDGGTFAVVNTTVDGAGESIGVLPYQVNDSRVVVRNNDVADTTTGVGLSEVSNSTVSVGDNAVAARAIGIRGYAIGGTTDLSIRDNDVVAGGSALFLDGFGGDVATVAHNTFDTTAGSAGEGATVLVWDLADGSRLGVTNNAILAGDGKQGITVDGSLRGTLAVEYNEIRGGTDGLYIAPGVTAGGLAVHYNAFVGQSAFGIRNDTSTTGGGFSLAETTATSVPEGAVNATHNYWGAPSGQGSNASDPDAPFEDPVTGTLADGTGTNVSEGETAGVSDVHFDPWLSAAPAANLTVAVDATNSPVSAGSTLRVTATVENVGDDYGTQTVTLSVGGTVRDSTTLRLAPGESATATLTWETSAGDAGTYTAEVASANDTATRRVTVGGLGARPGGGAGGCGDDPGGDNPGESATHFDCRR